MTQLSTLEIDHHGKIVGVSSPNPSSLLNNMLPPIDGDISSHWDDYTNNLFKGYLHDIFNTPYSVEFPIATNSHTLQFTAHLSTHDRAFLHVKLLEGLPIEQPSITNGKKRKKTRGKLLNSLLLDASTPIHFIDLDGNIVAFNYAAAELSGYTQEEYAILDIFKLVPKYTEEIWKQKFVDHAQAGRQTFEEVIKKKDGSLINVQMQTNTVKYGDAEVVYGCMTYLTEKSKQETKLNLVDFVFRNAPNPIYIVRKDASIYDCNDALPELLGYTKEELLTKKVYELDPNYNPKIWEKQWGTFKEGDTKTFQTKRFKKDGTQIDVEVKAKHLIYEGEELHCSFITDITEKKKIDDWLNMEHFIFRKTSIPIIVGLEDGSFLDINDNAIDLYGYSKEEMLVLKTDDLRVNKTKSYAELWAKVKALGKIEFESLHLKKDGTLMEVDIVANYFKYGGREVSCTFITDITKRKAEENRLRLMESVLVNTNDGVLITEAEPIDQPGPKIMYVNNAFTKTTGYAPEEIIGKTPRILQNEDTDRKELDRLRTALKKWEPCEITVSNSKKNGEKFWTNLRITPVANEKGWFTHWIAIQRDVTKEKEASVEKEKLLTELVENNKELLQFSYITTHNLRAPLTNLISICNRVDTRLIEDKQTKRLIEGFKYSTTLLNDTLNDLIKILIIKENRHLEINELFFGEILDKVKSSISTVLIKNAVQLEADFSQAASVHFSNVYLESIMLNLLTNAIKYAHPTRHPLVQIKTYIDAGGNTKLTFSDNGIGMNMAKIKNKIFGLYQRFHNNADAKGIGLYLVHSQVTALGGTIDVESEEGVGTTFTIAFK